MSIPNIEDYKPKEIVLGKVEEKAVKFYLPGPGDTYRPIRFRVPKMKIAFDPDVKKTRTGKKFVKNISLSTNPVGNDDNKNRTEIFATQIARTEKYIKRLLPEYLKDKQFVGSLWQGRNLDFKPVFKASINYDREESPQSGIFDGKGEPCDESRIEKGCLASMIVKLDKLWVWNDKI